MQAAWLLGAVVVPQLLSFGHGARGQGMEWEGGWGGALEEERERESLMLKVSVGGALWAWDEVLRWAKKSNGA